MSRQTDRERLMTLAAQLVNGFPTERNFRAFMKKMYKHEFGGRTAPTVRGLTERPRRRYEDADGYGEYWTEYGFFNGAGMSDDDIREYIDENIRVRIYSPYDCTGQPFTRFVHWHKNPTGLVSYINYMALDV